MRCNIFKYGISEGKMSNFDLINFLTDAHLKGASDIHLRLGKSPVVRILNSIIHTTMDPLDYDDFEDIFATVLFKDQHDKIKSMLNYDFPFEIEGLCRFRVNYCKDLGSPKITFRVIPYEVPTLEELSLPKSLRSFTNYNNGIILVTGPTGSGKSTTIASMIDIINKEQAKHIISIEDPIEFVYQDKKSLVTQRQLGIDVDTFADGIKYALRQDPDVIIVGEIRDRETLEAAFSAAETGHLVFSTVHTNSAVQTIIRVVNMFDESVRDFAKERLANTLRGTIAQKLIEKVDSGRTPALEIMTVTPAIKDYIMKNELEKIKPLMEYGATSSMTTMNNSIHGLLQAGIISQEAALAASDSPEELQQMIRGFYHGVKYSESYDPNRINFEE